MIKSIRSLAIAASVVLAAVSESTAALFVTTGQTGAQVQCDTSHTQWWTYSVNQRVSGVNGALFTMKDGPQTSAPITFTIIKGRYVDYGKPETPVLMSTTLANSAFTQSFDWRQFYNTGITLEANTTYTGILSSPAADNKQYFIKKGTLYFVDELGNPALPGVTISIGEASGDMVVPEPTALAMAGMASMALLGRWRRR